MTTAVVGGKTYVFWTPARETAHTESVFFSLNATHADQRRQLCRQQHNKHSRRICADNAVVGGTTYLFVEGVEDRHQRLFGREDGT